MCKVGIPASNNPANHERAQVRGGHRFPDVPGVWDMLARVFDLQGKAEEAQAARDKISELMGK